jgi:hypothetical protein
MVSVITTANQGFKPSGIETTQAPKNHKTPRIIGAEQLEEQQLFHQ